MAELKNNKINNKKGKVVVLPMSQMKKKRTFIGKGGQILNETTNGKSPVIR